MNRFKSFVERFRVQIAVLAVLLILVGGFINLSEGPSSVRAWLGVVLPFLLAMVILGSLATRRTR